jgi:sulfite reductase (NADPH) hemoprotein beta-component
MNWVWKVHAPGGREFAHLLTQDIEPPLAELERIKAHFADPAFEAGLSDDLDLSNPKFARWVKANTAPHKVPGYAIATISLKPVGGIPGDATADQIARWPIWARPTASTNCASPTPEHRAAPCPQGRPLHPVGKAGRRRSGHRQSGQHHRHHRLPRPRLLLAGQCALDPVAQKISERFTQNGKEETLGELKLKISGCINACGHHHAGHIGILGVDRKGTENYQLLLGGSERPTPRWAPSPAPVSARTALSMPSTRSPTSIWPSVRMASASSTPIAAMAPFKEVIYG